MSGGYDWRDCVPTLWKNYNDAITVNIKRISQEVNNEIFQAADGDENEMSKIIKFSPYIFFQQEIDKKVPFSLEVDLTGYIEPDNEDLLPLSTALLCIDLAVMYMEAEEIIDAVKSMNDAANWLGMYQGIIESSRANHLKRKSIAQNAAIQKHKPTSEIKDKVVKFYLNNKYKSKDQAAEKIRSELKVPYAYRTVRQWLNNV